MHMDANIPYITYQHKYETATVDKRNKGGGWKAGGGEHIRGDVADSEYCVNLYVTDTVYKPPSVFLYGTKPPPPMA